MRLIISDCAAACAVAGGICVWAWAWAWDGGDEDGKGEFKFEYGAGAGTGIEVDSLVGEEVGEVAGEGSEEVGAGGAALKATRTRRKKSSLLVPAAMYSFSSPCFMMTTVGVLGNGKICDR